MANKEWHETISVVANSLCGEFHDRYPFENDGDVSPEVVALRDAFYAFPVSADVLLIDTGSTQSCRHYGMIGMGADFIPGPIWTLIAHHNVNTSHKEVRFHGTRLLEDLDSYLPLLAKSFGLDHESHRSSIGDLQFAGCWTWDSTEIVDFVPYDIRAYPKEYGRYLAGNLFRSHRDVLISRYKKEVDYNALYGLNGDPVLTLQEWTKIDSLTAAFVKLDDFKPLTFEERQAGVSNIQLIPKVPRDVEVAFRRAKDAYICGYFRYDFYTIAVHYASLALEAAVKARWSIGLPQKVTVTCRGNMAEIHFPSHKKISDLCSKNKWKREPFVNDRRFPFSMNQLLDWLERDNVVTKWERECLRKGLNMRNELSHVEHSSTHMPSSDELVFIARLINKLFHSVP